MHRLQFAHSWQYRKNQSVGRENPEGPTNCDSAKVHAAYRDFALWKDADPNIRILKQAKAEYAKLQ